MRTLVLDSAYFPIKIVSWQNAMVLFVMGRAQIISCYQNKKIKSPSKSYKLPKILRLYTKHRFERKSVRFNRYNVFHRDNYTCQYCEIKFKHNQLTLDHIIPKSKGGETSFKNIVTCCADCNSKKADKDLKNFSYALKNRPQAPKWNPRSLVKLKVTDPKEWFDWVYVEHIKKKAA